MKKIILMLALLIGVSGFCQSQKWDAELPPYATTPKEYNYLTKGLKIQLESGLDVISGYILQKGTIEKVGNYNYNIQYLVQKDNNRLKAISVIITSSVSGKTYYVCIPYGNNGLTQQYWGYINLFDAPMSQSYAYIMGKLYSEKMTNSSTVFGTKTN